MTRPCVLAPAFAALLALAACGDGEPDVAHEISQKNKSFDPDSVTIDAGQTLLLRNDDTHTHNIRVFHPKMDYNSGSQDPGEDIRLTFDAPGTYYVTCGIHPEMELKVEVRETGSKSGG
jgi:cytochrome c peroxidase